MKFRRLRQILSNFGIEWDKSRGRGSHGVFRGQTHSSRLNKVYPIPKEQQKDTSQVYIKPLRRTFELTEEYGVSDDLFS